MKKANISASIPPDVKYFELEGEGILYSGRAGRLVHLNPTAAFVWTGIAQGIPLQSIAEDISAAFSQDLDSVLCDCRQIVAEWSEAGLFDPGSGQDAVEAPESGGTRTRSPDGTPPDWKECEPSLVSAFRLGSFSFELRSGDSGAEASIHRMLQPILAEQDSEAKNRVYEFRSSSSVWRLYSNRKWICDCSDGGELYPQLHAQIMLDYYQAQDCLAALHTAALAGDRERCILLAGPPGSGKSTLTAAAISRGFGYLADDTVLLSSPPIRAFGIAMPLGIKEGSWQPLAEYWPQLSEQKVHLRADGKNIRYLAPPGWTDIAKSSDGSHVAAIVFLTYQDSSPTVLTRLTPATALVRLGVAGYDVGGGLSEQKVSSMVDWILATPAYELTYSDVPEALLTLRGLLE